MGTTDIAFRSATALCAALRSGELSSVQLLEHYLERIGRLDGAVNAVVVRQFDKARAKALAADRLRATGGTLGTLGTLGPLHGLPMTVKESFHVTGLQTAWGSPQLAGNISTTTAEAVARLERAGAILLGKTNTPLFLADWQSYNAIHGTTRNPHDATRTPGGSSGGAAAAVAAGFTGADFGSDLAGSLRVPASFCGVYAHKPTYGLVPTAGHAVVPGFSAIDLSVVGPITRSADDLELLLTAAMGPLPLEARGWKLDLPPAPASLKGMRFALLMDSDFAPVEQAVRAALGAFADWLRSEGATVTTVALPLPQLEHQLLFLALLKGVLSTRMDDAGFAAALENARRFDAADTGFDAIAARDMVQHHRTWARHNEARAKLRDTWRTFFESFDCLLLPGTPTAAFAIDESEPQGKRTLDVDGRRVPYGVQGFWQGIASTSYLPATVAPIGRSSTGLPLSVQIVGGAFDDLKTIAVARHAEAHYFPFSPPAGFA